MNRRAHWRSLLMGLAIALIASTAWANEPASIDLIYEQLAPSDGAPVIPAIQNDIVYLAAEVRDADGELLDDVPISLSSTRDNELVGPKPVTRDGGYTDLALVARSLGRDTLTVSAGSVSTQIGLDVREPDAVDDYASALEGIDDSDNVLGWAALMKAQIDYDEQFRVSATYPAALKERFGQSVRLVGYMLPMQMSTTQTRFILSANPPVCFFHMPGGPATVVDVHTQRAMEMTWEPVVVEGTLQAETQTDDGLLYRLTDARVVNR